MQGSPRLRRQGVKVLVLVLALEQRDIPLFPTADSTGS